MKKLFCDNCGESLNDNFGADIGSISVFGTKTKNGEAIHIEVSVQHPPDLCRQCWGYTLNKTAELGS